MNGLYLLLLSLSIAGLAIIDIRYRLVFSKNRRLAVKVLGICMLMFIVWDIAGIVLNIFFIGQTDLLLGIRFGDFPLEEIFFLILLNYTALVLSQYLKVRGRLE